jgi:hypothetical protein
MIIKQTIQFAPVAIINATHASSHQRTARVAATLLIDTLTLITLNVPVLLDLSTMEIQLASPLPWHAPSHASPALACRPIAHPVIQQTDASCLPIHVFVKMGLAAHLQLAAPRTVEMGKYSRMILSVMTVIPTAGTAARVVAWFKMDSPVVIPQVDPRQVYA